MYIEAVISWTSDEVDNNGPNTTIYLIFLTHSDVKSFYLIQENFISSWLVDYVNKGTRDYVDYPNIACIQYDLNWVELVPDINPPITSIPNWYS